MRILAFWSRRIIGCAGAVRRTSIFRISGFDGKVNLFIHGWGLTSTVFQVGCFIDDEGLLIRFRPCLDRTYANNWRAALWFCYESD